jgi:hypothetical protein
MVDRLTPPMYIGPELNQVPAFLVSENGGRVYALNNALTQYTRKGVDFQYFNTNMICSSFAKSKLETPASDLAMESHRRMNPEKSTVVKDGSFVMVRYEDFDLRKMYDDLFNQINQDWRKFKKDISKRLAPIRL